MSIVVINRLFIRFIELYHIKGVTFKRGESFSRVMKPDIKTVREGVFALHTVGVELLDLEGKNHTVALRESLFDQNLNLFNSLVEQLGYDPELTAHVLADARLNTEWQDNTQLYIDGLIVEAERITQGTSYMDMEDRDKLVGFLYRPTKLRVMTFAEKMNVLYPEMYKHAASTESVDLVENINMGGLQKVMRYRLENPEPVPVEVGVAHKIWEQEGWIEYIEPVNLPKDAPRNLEFKGTIAIGSLPQDVEYLALDVRDYKETGMGLRALMFHMETAIPAVKDLAKQGYFGQVNPKDFSRHLMLQKVFGD